MVITAMPGVRNVAVVGAAHEKWGETPVAFVVSDEGAVLAADDVIAFTRQRLAGFKVPTRVEFIEALPTTTTGKVQKNILRERLLT